MSASNSAGVSDPRREQVPAGEEPQRCTTSRARRLDRGEVDVAHVVARDDEGPFGRQMRRAVDVETHPERSQERDGPVREQARPDHAATTR